ncbi:RNA-directed DNA polymerase from mobile element jockey [Trichonephila clavipes]|nr:RNA-directed DNA polymerase from mobile element jockey [Trichonephila clavipes]
MRDFVDKHAPDLFLIQETHLRPEDSFRIPNYRCYRNDRTRPAPGRGGTAVLIKNCIPHYHVPTPPQFTGVEATLLMLTPKDHEPILIGSTYIPPINDYFRNLGAALDTIFNITNMTILVGNSNAKHTSWGCPVNDARGNRLYRYVVNSGIDVIAPPTPTRFGTASATIIDYALMKNLNWPCTIDSISELSSDHNPIKLNFPRTPSFEIPPPQLYTNWKIFTNNLANNDNLYLPQANSTPEIESQVNDLTNSSFGRNTLLPWTPKTDHTNNTDPIPPALPSEVINYIKKIKVKKSPGRDGVTNKMIKNLPLLTVFKITNIINNMFKLRYFPNAWKTAVVIPILKPGKNPKLAESHRPISLLPILSKLAEKIISARLNDYLENENILVPEQHGFRPRLSTTHQLLRVVEYIKDGIDRHQYTAAVFLDIQKAFDRVWHTGLLFKLIMYKIPPPLILLLKSYISDRSFTVKINRTFSQVRPAKAGVAQGSILGPVLFNLYVNDILKTTNTMICMYADDSVILSRHYNPNTLTQNINEHLAHLEIWFSVWKIALNTTKTEAVFFTQRRPPPEITLQNQRIPWSQHTKYFGVIIDKNLTFRQHITYVRNKFKNATRQLYSLICKKSKLNRHNKMLIYTLILKPLLTYASPIWAHAARTNINLIEISQNFILRQILDAHWYIRNADIRSALNIPTIRQTIRKLAINFFSNIDGHENPSIQEIPTYPTYPFIRRPRDILVDPDFN